MILSILIIMGWINLAKMLWMNSCVWFVSSYMPDLIYSFTVLFILFWSGMIKNNLGKAQIVSSIIRLATELYEEIIWTRLKWKNLKLTCNG